MNNRWIEESNIISEIYLAPGFSPKQVACSQSLCQNGGTCQSHGLGATCVCKAGFTGQRCELGL